ncbi:MAG: hypothetical protein IJL20_02070 [Lachnospiraceae bacterium]|nr:hypothetical protein [Lachnospiraceae bacterium]
MRYKNKRTVLIYMLVFLLVSLAGMLYSRYPFFKNFSEIFYGGIIVVWAMTVLRRIIESQIKELLIENAILLIMLILFRALRFQFDQGHVTVHRFMWYCYYIPLLYIPVISFKLSLRCGRSENIKLSRIWNLLLIPSTVLAILVLTNDKHHLAFRFPDIAGKGYDLYTYGPVYYIIVVWMALLLSATVIITIIRFSSKPVRKDSWAYYVVLLGSAYFLLTDYFGLAPVVNGVQYLTPMETFAVFTVCGWEACIQTCLLPSNSGYKYFFENSGLIARITDKAGNVKIASKGGEFDFSPSNENYHILEKEVWGGKLSYAEDISGITESNRELKEISERLLEENALQEAENALQEDRVHVSVMNKLYDDITEFSAEKTEEIEKLLTSAGSDDDFKQNLEKACILASYIKRRGNLYLLGEENKHYDFNDLYLSFKESLDYFALSGAKTLLTLGNKMEVDTDTGLKAYDCLEAYLEKLFGKVNSLLVHMDASDNELKVRFMYDEESEVEVFASGKEAEA